MTHTIWKHMGLCMTGSCNVITLNLNRIIQDFAKKENKKFVRMDTCGLNDRLINHYKNCGFEFLGMKKLKDSSGLQAHYHNADVCFFEIELK